MAIKTPSILPELQKFVATIGDTVPYDKLLSTAAEAGWQYRLVQRDIVFTPDDGYMVTFDVHVGRDGAYEMFDVVTITLPRDAGRIYPVSLVARAQILPSLILMFFGRLPPQVAPRAPVERTIDVSDAESDIVLDLGEETPASEAEDRGFTEATPFVPVKPEDIDVVDHREPDGVPIFKDLYDSFDDSIPASTVIAAMLAVIEPFSIRASSKEQLLALYTKNADINQFMLDFGTPEERAKLKEVLDRALARLSEPAREVRLPPGGPRRRSKAA